MHHYPSEMAQNFWTAIWAFSACFIATACVSLATKQRRSNEELTGLVYALTPRPKEENVPWHRQPAILGGAVLALTLILNLVFW
jgi:SSS family solute:Na+ symporter